MKCFASVILLLMILIHLGQTGVALENMGAAVQGDAGFRETCASYLIPLDL
jgi:hypothetical protein